MSIRYANISSSVGDHRQKFSVFNSSIGSGRTNESNGLYKEGSLKLTSSEALSSEAVHQKLTSSGVLKIIRS